MARAARRKTSFFRRFLNRLILLFFVLLATIVSIISAIIYKEAQELPDISDLKTVASAQTSRIYSSDGALLASLFSENRVIIPLADVSQNTINAVIAAEDERFFSHPGIDVIGILRALIRDIKAGEIEQGGSTITQQYVKNAYFSNERTVSRKIKEAILAYRLERKSSKDEILENYLNTIYFGHGAYGIETASETFFGKEARNLSIAESALLAGLIKSPQRYSPYNHTEKALASRNRVLVKMKKLKYIDEDELGIAMEAPVNLQPLRPRHYLRAPYFVEYVRKNLVKVYGEEQLLRGGLKVITTLDSRLQGYAEQAASEYFKASGDPSVGIIVTDPNSGAIRAMVGGKNFSTAQFDLVTQGKRQPGSAFKPFVLATAIAEGISPDRVYDGSSPKKIKLDSGGFWNVDNYEGANKGDISLRDATAYSVNTVFAQLIMETGVEKVIDNARALGINEPINTDPAIALGGLDKGVTPLDMAIAYGAFENGGYKYEPFSVVRITDTYNRMLDEAKLTRRPVLDPTVAYLVTDVLRGVIKKGTGARADIGRDAAGKTGTTQDNGDAWFIGFTPELVACIWVGFPDSNRAMKPVNGKKMTGGYLPAMIWKNLMVKAVARKPQSKFAEPADMNTVKVTVCGESNMQNYQATEFCPKKTEQIHIKGFEPKVSCPVHRPKSDGNNADVNKLKIDGDIREPGIVTDSIGTTSQPSSSY